MKQLLYFDIHQCHLRRDGISQLNYFSNCTTGILKLVLQTKKSFLIVSGFVSGNTLVI